MKNTLLTLVGLLGSFLTVNAQTARVMAIHNSADPAVDTVDIWLSTVLGSQKLFDNVGFRQSTGFFTAPAGVPIRVAFAGKNSQTINDTLIGFGFNLTSGQTYLAIAQGHVGTGFNPQIPFNLAISATAKERGSNGKVEVAVHHGSTDAPNVDIDARAKGALDGARILENVPYGDISQYLAVDEANILLDVFQANAMMPLVSYSAPLQQLNAGDSAVVIFASGFLNPANNNNGKPFGLFAALSNGDVIPLEALTSGRVNVIHNCADPAADTVDIWVKNETTNQTLKVADNLGFRQATGYTNLIANNDLILAVAPKNSSSYDDVIYEEDIDYIPAGSELVVIATGVLDTTKFEPNPNEVEINFGILGAAGRENGTNPNNVDLLVYHGVTDAPAVSIRARNATSGFDSLAFGDFSSDEGEYVSLAANNIILDVIPVGATSPLVSYNAPLSALAGQAVVAFASGFLSPNSPTNRDVNGAAFGIFVARSNGQVIPLQLTTSVAKVSEAFENGIVLYPNPANEKITIQFESTNTISATQVNIVDLSGRAVLTSALDVNNGLNKHEINIAALQKGLYFIQVTNASGTSVKKLMIN
ncbi:MAG: T9SS type A sorting domain-containing protein [Bacteroidia bacterium]|jgi:hypothetical protein|nr:T9SS type A sorting domain-containing protein [Bacteroidia bacterium]